MTSVNTNQSALIALQHLNQTNDELTATQARVSTGLKIAGAKDNGSIWAIAQTQKAQSSSLDAVTNSLNNAKSVMDTTLSAGSQLTDILSQMRNDALAASDQGIDDDSRAKYAADFQSLAKSYANTIASATFNGVNLLDAGSGTVSALGSADATVTVDTPHSKLNVTTAFPTMKAFTSTAGAFTNTAPAAVDTITATANAWTGATGAADAAADLAQVDVAMKSVTAGLADLGVAAKSIDNQIKLISKLQDSLNTGVGNLVDADLAKESANLQALQVKQQLGVQALSIANSSPQVLLSLFK